MHTWSENPKKDMLQHLEMFTYKNNCKKLLSGKIKSNRKINTNYTPNIIDKKASEIAFCIKQGIEFFKNAEDADISISPLLIYYGILSFSKSLIIANSKENIFLDDIKYHGLTTRPRNIKQNKQKNNKKSWKLINEYANTNNGVFLELGKIFGIDIKKDYIFKLKDTLACIPEIKNISNKLKIIDSKVIDCYSEIVFKCNKISFAIYSIESDILERICPKLKKDFVKENMHGSNSFIEYKSINNMNLQDFNYLYNYSSVYGGRYFIPQTNYIENEINKKILLPQILLDYINFFILSEQVRYHQDNWKKVLNGENDTIISILKIYIECTKRKFPNLILNELFNENFSYGSPAYLN